MRNRLRNGGDASLEYIVGRSEYGVASADSRLLAGAPADLIPQTASGARLATAGSAALAPVVPLPSRSVSPLAPASMQSPAVVALPGSPGVAAPVAMPGGDALAQIAAKIEARLQQSFRVNDAMRYPDNLTTIPVSVGLASQLALERATNKRVYLFIINTHPTQRLFVTFGQAATVLNGVPIAAALGSFEWLFTVPQGDVHLIANGAATTGVILYAEMALPQ